MNDIPQKGFRVSSYRLNNYFSVFVWVLVDSVFGRRASLFWPFDPGGHFQAWVVDRLHRDHENRTHLCLESRSRSWLVHKCVNLTI